MADKKITQLNNITGANLANNDEFVVVDISADETMAVTRAELFLSVPAITVDGRLGIGTTSPIQELHIAANGIAGMRIEDTDADGGYADIEVNGQALFIEANDEDGTEGIIVFRTAGSETARIDTSGNLLVGRTSALSASSGKGWAFASTGYGITARDGTQNQTHMYFQNNAEVSATVVGTIKTSGSSTSYNTSSDYRLKTDAQPMVGASARVQALNPVNFQWIGDSTRVDGFIAHEAQAVVPEAVHGIQDEMKDEEYEITAATGTNEAVMGTRNVPEYQGIDQSKLVPLLTAALQEALTKIEAMETRLAALEE